MGEVTATGWGILVTGLVLAIAAATELLKYYRYRWRAEHVTGVVVELASSVSAATGGARPHTVYHPVLQFTTKDGHEVRAKVKVGTNPPVAREGQAVSVLYDPEDPTEAEIARKGWIRLALLGFLGILGLFFIGLFLIAMI